jgi:hypothetical protein
MRLIVLTLVCTSFLAAAAAAGSAPAREGGTVLATLDRTFSCTPDSLAPGVRELDALAIPAGSSWTGARQERPSPGYLSLNTGGWKPGAELVAVRAKVWQRFGAATPPGVFTLSASCRASRAAVPLQPRGLDGPTRWAESVSCLLAGKVVVRVRATLQSAAPWQRASQAQFGVSRNVVAATLAVRKEKARSPFAVLKLDARGRTTLWVSPECS